MTNPINHSFLIDLSLQSVENAVKDLKSHPDKLTQFRNAISVMPHSSHFARISAGVLQEEEVPSWAKELAKTIILPEDPDRILEFCQEGDLKSLQECRECSSEYLLALQDESGNSPLYLAIKAGHWQVAQFLVKQSPELLEKQIEEKEIPYNLGRDKENKILSLITLSSPPNCTDEENVIHTIRLLCKLRNEFSGLLLLNYLLDVTSDWSEIKKIKFLESFSGYPDTMNPACICDKMGHRDQLVHLAAFCGTTKDLGDVEEDIFTLKAYLTLGAKASIKQGLDKVAQYVDKERDPLALDHFIDQHLHRLGMDELFDEWVNATIEKDRVLRFLTAFLNRGKKYLEKLIQDPHSIDLMDLQWQLRQNPSWENNIQILTPLISTLLYKKVKQNLSEGRLLRDDYFVRMLYYSEDGPFIEASLEHAPAFFRDYPLLTLITHTPDFDERFVRLMTAVKEAGLSLNLNQAINQIIRSRFDVRKKMFLLKEVQKLAPREFLIELASLPSGTMMGFLRNTREDKSENNEVWIDIFRFLYRQGAKMEGILHDIWHYDVPERVLEKIRDLLINHDYSMDEVKRELNDYSNRPILPHDFTRLRIIVEIIIRSAKRYNQKSFIPPKALVEIMKSTLFLSHDIKQFPSELFSTLIGLVDKESKESGDWNADERYWELCKNYNSNPEIFSEILQLYLTYSSFSNQRQLLHRLISNREIGLLGLCMEEFYNTLWTDPNHICFNESDCSVCTRPDQITGLAPLSEKLISNLQGAGWKALTPNRFSLTRNGKTVGLVTVDRDLFKTTLLDPVTEEPFDSAYSINGDQFEFQFQNRAIENDPDSFFSVFPEGMVVHLVEGARFDTGLFAIHPVIFDVCKDQRKVKAYSLNLRTGGIDLKEFRFDQYRLLDELEAQRANVKGKIDEKMVILEDYLLKQFTPNATFSLTFDGQKTTILLKHMLASGESISFRMVIKGIPSLSSSAIQTLSKKWTNYFDMTTAADRILSENGGEFYTDSLKSITISKKIRATPFFAHLYNDHLILKAIDHMGKLLFSFPCSKNEMETAVPAVAKLVPFINTYSFNEDTLKSLTFDEKPQLHQAPAEVSCTELVKYIPVENHALRSTLNTLLINLTNNGFIRGFNANENPEEFQRMRIHLTHTIAKRESEEKFDELKKLAIELANASAINGCGPWIRDIINVEYLAAFGLVHEDSSPCCSTIGDLIKKVYRQTFLDQINKMVLLAMDPEVRKQTRHFKNYLIETLGGLGFSLPLASEFDPYTPYYGKKEIPEEHVPQVFFSALKPQLIINLWRMQKDSPEITKLQIDTLIESLPPNNELEEERDEALLKLRAKQSSLKESYLEAKSSEAYQNYERLLNRLNEKKMEKNTLSNKRLQIITHQKGVSLQIAKTRATLLEAQFQECEEIINTASVLLQPLAEIHEIQATLQLEAELSALTQKIDQTAINYTARLHANYLEILENEGFLEPSDPKDELSDLQVSLKGAAKLLETTHFLKIN